MTYERRKKMKRKINSQNMIFLAIVTLFWFAQYVYIPYQTTYLTAAGTAGSVVGSVVGAGVISFCLALLLKEEKRNVSGSSLTVPELFQVCRGRRIIVFSLIALIQQGIQLTTTMSFTNQILKDCGASDGLVGISSIIYMVSAVCFSALASSKFCERRGPRFWIPTVLAVLAVYAIGMTTFPMFTGSIVSAGGMEAGYLVLAGIAILGIIIAKVYYIRETCRGI